jgi:hypothetical protein
MADNAWVKEEVAWQDRSADPRRKKRKGRSRPLRGDGGRVVQHKFRTRKELVDALVCRNSPADIHYFKR